MTTPLKLAIAGISVGGIGGGAIYLSTTQTTKKEETKTTPTTKLILEWLAEESEVALISEDENAGNAWEAAWKKFKEVYENKFKENKDWNSLDNKKNENNAPEEFKNLCTANSKKTVQKTETIYEEVKTYCTKAKG